MALSATLLLVVTTSAPAAADVRRFWWPKGVVSPQFTFGSCPYKVFYGDFGDVAFSQVRLFPGCTGNVILYVDYAEGNSSVENIPGEIHGGNDSDCGTYFWLQATSGHGHKAIGVAVDFGGSGLNIREFRASGGEMPHANPVTC